VTAFNRTSLEEEYSESYRGFINVFSKRATGFHWQAKLFELNKFHYKKKLSTRWSNQAGKIVLAAGQFARCLAVNETPGA